MEPATSWLQTKHEVLFTPTFCRIIEGSQASAHDFSDNHHRVGREKQTHKRVSEHACTVIS